MANGRRKIVSRWTIVFLLVLLMIVQGVCLDQYFYNYYKQDGWKSFICAYLPAVVLFLWQQIVETRDEDPVQSTEQEEFDGTSTTFITLKRLITGYHKMFTWLLYVVPSIFQYVWILSTFVEDIEPSVFFGPRFLRVILCFPSGVFLFLDTIEYAVKPELNVEWWRVFDLFDTVELLQILLPDRNIFLTLNQTTKTSMLFFGSTSLFFPAFSLWELQACRKIPSETAGSNNLSVHKRTRLVSRVRIVSKVCQLLFVNTAFLVLRLVLFFDFNLDASLFVAKNVIAITVGVIEIISACRGKRVKGSQENMNLRGTFKNPAYETGSDRSLAQITATSSSTQTVASDFPNDQQKRIKPGDLSLNDLKRRNRDPEKLLSDPCLSKLDGISFDSNTSETSLCLPSHIGATFTKVTESRSTRTTMAEIPRDQLHCQLCGSQEKPRLTAERFRNPLGYTESVLADSRFCSPRDSIVPESNQLSSAFQKTARQEQRFLRQNPPGKFESRICSPDVTDAKESKPICSALQQNKTTEHEHSKTQSPLRESPVSLDPCDDSKLALSSNMHVKEFKPPFSSWQQQTTKQGKRSNAQNLRGEKVAIGGDSRVRCQHDTRIEELNHLYASSLRTTTKQEESFSEMKNFRREKPAAINPRVQLSFNPRGEELNAYNSPSLDHTSADNETSEIHLGFTRSNNGLQRFSERPGTESITRHDQYRRHQRKRHDSRQSGHNMHTPAFTVWNTRN